ncbi:MAG TPA: gluconate 2-dehydrogenase subunit 3 family protein [Xanthobacteraceae bacterium]|nr:gluconate 2-dehydrogenase subunit 3 family protein [Xanthobacteraceae bacterium]
MIGTPALLHLNRRQLLGSSAVVLLALSASTARSAIVKGGLPWKPGAANPPTPVSGEGWHYFTSQEGALVEAIVDHLIPADELSPGGKDCGCAVFIDRQMAGPQGRAEGLYMSGPFQKGTKQQGPQSADTPAQQYRKGLAAFDAACHNKFSGKSFAQLSDQEKDEAIKGLEDGSLKLGGIEAKDFFKLILKDTQNGFLADPIYGGNRNMASWKMIGFPGTHYDYREWIDRHNQRVTLPTVAIATHPNWAS